MPVQKESPYSAHVFVCTNDRKGERKSCADDNSALVKSKLKDAVEEKGWRERCEFQPQGVWGCAPGDPL